jgi:hypothetical protein
MADSFKGQPVHRDSPATDWFGITPNDGADIPLRPRFIFVGTAGNVVMRGDSDVSVTVALTVGWHPIGPKRILATGTTAAAISGFV